MLKTGPILVVDDDPDDRDFIQAIFHQLRVPNQIKFARDGKSAFDYLKSTRERPFLILCDVNMPKVNGIQFRNMIINDPELKSRRIPFVFLTTAATPAGLEDAYKMEVQGFFEKPTSIEDWKDTIKLIIEYWSGCQAPILL